MSGPIMENIIDENGDSMELCRNAKGRFGAGDWNIDTWNTLHCFPVRRDDVFLCSYAKSGCHWMWEILRQLTLGEGSDLEKVDKETYMVELNTMEDLENLNSPRILNNHAYFDEQPVDKLLENQTKVVFIYRNLKDVAVSFYYHHVRFVNYPNTFSRYLRRFVAGLLDNDSVFGYLRSWEQGVRNTRGLQVHVARYEDLKEDPVREIQKVDAFMGTNSSDDLISKIAADTDFSTMKKKKTQVTMFRDDAGSPVMYRKGQVGDWKNHFTVADNEWFEEVLEKELGGSEMFNFRYTL